MKNYKNIHRGQWAELKLKEVLHLLPNKTVSDIGSGFGWFGPIVKNLTLDWQPFDYTRKIEEATIWDLNNPAPAGNQPPGFVIFLEVLEHLSNPELGIRNIAAHIQTGGYIALTTPNPLSAESKIEIIFKNNLYAFQPKHLQEHHVYVPLPHIVKFHLENNGFEIIEMATIGNFPFPRFSFRLGYINAVIHYFMVRMLVAFRSDSKGGTLAFFAKKVRESIIIKS